MVFRELTLAFERERRMRRGWRDLSDPDPIPAAVAPSRKALFSQALTTQGERKRGRGKKKWQDSLLSLSDRSNRLARVSYGTF